MTHSRPVTEIVAYSLFYLLLESIMSFCARRSVHDFTEFTLTILFAIYFAYRI